MTDNVLPFLGACFAKRSNVVEKPNEDVLNRKYPHKCVRCGMCCLAETCIAGQLHYNISKFKRCPALSFSPEGQAICGLVKLGLVPIGDGCCIKARAFKDGIEYDFAGLPEALKRRAASDRRRHI